jgi:hypothetical protein
MRYSPKSNYPALEIDQCKHSTGDLPTLDPCSRSQYIFLCLRISQQVISHTYKYIVDKKLQSYIYELSQENFPHLDLVTEIKLFRAISVLNKAVGRQNNPLHHPPIPASVYHQHENPILLYYTNNIFHQSIYHCECTVRVIT